MGGEWDGRVCRGRVLPGGRVTGEVARATFLSAWIGAPRAVALAAANHGAHLWATTLIAGVCCSLVTEEPLRFFVFLTLVTTCVLGALFVVGPRYARLGRWVSSRFRILVTSGDEFDGAVRARPIIPKVAIGAHALARCLQVIQAGMLLTAVGIDSDASAALVATSVQLVAANLGDAVPGQAGLVEGAHRLLASNVGTAAQLISLVLLLRIARLMLGAVCLALPSVLRVRLWKRAM